MSQTCMIFKSQTRKFCWWGIDTKLRKSLKELKAHDKATYVSFIVLLSCLSRRVEGIEVN
ncbi:hypothetical protein Mapa_002716 [Marchantia paleacea]|nr:hypothetical protein Mapa_002716 [Marchantia paleacea]